MSLLVQHYSVIPHFYAQGAAASFLCAADALEWLGIAQKSSMK
jgi:hypothetical protein